MAPMQTSTGTNSAMAMRQAERRHPDTATAPAAITTWLLSDGKPGHEAQLQGLGQALARRQPVELTWIDVANRRAGWTDLLRGRYPGLTAPHGPALAVAAGHGTHRQLLALGLASDCVTCVLMRPSLPLRWFDAAVIPRHDLPPRSSRVLATDGVLNPILPATKVDGSRGLVLLGGPSRHFHFPVEDVCARVALLCQRFPEMHWTASTSRRTPAGTMDALTAKAIANLQVISHTDTPRGWVAQMLSSCAQAWITEDSVSMVYEALSAGTATGLLALPTARAGRLQRGMETLHRRNMINLLDPILAGHSPQRPTQPLQEADRAADWLLQKLSKMVRT